MLLVHHNITVYGKVLNVGNVLSPDVCSWLSCKVMQSKRRKRGLVLFDLSTYVSKEKNLSDLRYPFWSWSESKPDTFWSGLFVQTFSPNNVPETTQQTQSSTCSLTSILISFILLCRFYFLVESPYSTVFTPIVCMLKIL